MNATRPARLAVDIGGTFTDAVLEQDSVRISAKVLTSYPDPTEGFMTAVRLALERAGCPPSSVGVIVHGTTLATNALIERKGARTALVTTAGFRDVLEIATESRFALYDLFITRAEPLVPRPLRFEVPERIAADGTVLLPLDEAAVRALVPRLAAAEVESVAIGFLQAYANSVHEERTEAILREALPNLSITRAADVCAEVREYDRFSTACANAYIRPLMAHYLAGLEQALARAGLACPLLIMSSGGGMMTPEVAQRYPVRLIESGPAGGTILAAEIAQACGLDKAMSFDMGGTTAKICFIDDGEPQHARSFEAARVYRFAKGSGMPLRIPVVEMVEIGAGGGSIARIDALGRLAVGPESASADPGPACYARGGKRPTVTDANLVAGRIEASRFAGGSIPLDRSSAVDALCADVGAALELKEDLCASAVIEVVEENMANAARVHAIEGGRESAQYTMIAFGGGAPLHAAAVANKLGMDRVLVPRGAGVGSAIGFLRAPVAFETALSWVQRTEALDIEAANARVREIAARARQLVKSASDSEPIEDRRVLMRYRGQGHEIEVRLPGRDLTAADRDGITAAFIAEYTRLYGRSIPGLATEIITWLVAVRSPVAPVARLDQAPQATRLAHVGSRRSYIDARTGERETLAVVERTSMDVNTWLAGPAVVVEDETSTFVPHGWRVGANQRGDLLLDRVKLAAAGRNGMTP
jgi:N-methylhydantoinase A